MGNSHAQHLVPMLDEVALNNGFRYVALTISNCRLTSATQLVHGISFKFDLCKEYFDRYSVFVDKNAKKGDVVLIGSKSLFFKPKKDHENDNSRAFMGAKNISRLDLFNHAKSELGLFLAKLSERGVHLIFAGPTPEYSLSATQCYEEWFRKRRSGCAVDFKTAKIKLFALEEYLSHPPFNSLPITIWNPLLDLCDAGKCEIQRGEELLFRDKHHLSLQGSRSLAANFDLLLRDVLEKKN